MKHTPFLLHCLALAMLLHGGATSAEPTTTQLYQTHCAPCHGPSGEGSRGPRLATPQLVHASDLESLIDIVTRGVPGTEMLAATLEPDQIRALAGMIWEWTKIPMPKAEGSIERGAQLYRSKGQCATCHAIRGAGGVYGPDLSDVGNRRGVDYLKRALIEPEKEVPENFSQYRWFTRIPDNFLYVEATTKSGIQIAGSRLNEDAFAILIRDASGAIHSLRKADLANLKKDWGRSPMPSYAHLSGDEIRDIVAYLSSLRGSLRGNP